MTKLSVAAILVVLASGCSPGDPDHLGLYDTRRASDSFILENYQVYPGLDVPSRYTQNGDTSVVYQLSVDGYVEYKIWIYEGPCDLPEGDIETDLRSVGSEAFRESALGLGGDRCEHSAIHSYID